MSRISTASDGGLEKEQGMSITGLRIALAVGGSTSGTEHLAELYPELRTPNGSNILMVFGLGD